MRVEISKDGRLVVIADNTVEAWALNGIALFQDDNVGSRITIDCSVLNICDIKADDIDDLLDKRVS